MTAPVSCSPISIRPLRSLKDDIREGADRNGKGRVFRALGRRDDHIGQADQLLLDRAVFLVLVVMDVLFLCAVHGPCCRWFGAFPLVSSVRFFCEERHLV